MLKTAEETAEKVASEYWSTQFNDQNSAELVLKSLVTESILADRKERDKKVIEVLEKIHRGEGEFSKDRLTHAINTIESMKSLASALLAELRKGEK